MLKEIRIENLTLVEKTNVEPGFGLNCITGETGAGKSALLYSFKLLAGQKADKARIRKGKEKAFVEGTFLIKDSSTR